MSTIHTLIFGGFVIIAIVTVMTVISYLRKERDGNNTDLDSYYIDDSANGES